MGKRGRPEGPRPSRARTVYRGLQGWIVTIRGELETAWKNHRREAGRAAGNPLALQRAREHFVDAAAIGEMLKALATVGLAQLTERDIDILAKIDIERGRLIDEEQAMLEAGVFPGPDLDTWYPGVEQEPPPSPVAPIIRRRKP